MIMPDAQFDHLSSLTAIASLVRQVDVPVAGDVAPALYAQQEARFIFERLRTELKRLHTEVGVALDVLIHALQQAAAQLRRLSSCDAFDTDSLLIAVARSEARCCCLSSGQTSRDVADLLLLVEVVMNKQRSNTERTAGNDVAREMAFVHEQLETIHAWMNRAAAIENKPFDLLRAMISVHSANPSDIKPHLRHAANMLDAHVARAFRPLTE